MSRASLVLLILLVAIVAGLVWLSRSPTMVAPHPIEQVVTLNGADAATR